MSPHDAFTLLKRSFKHEFFISNNEHLETRSNSPFKDIVSKTTKKKSQLSILNEDSVCTKVSDTTLEIDYIVPNLYSWELPIIGTYIDNRICVGYKYNVRMCSPNTMTKAYDASIFSNKEPQILLSIGNGYGKRLTFSSPQLNDPCNVFWSDCAPFGYAFSIIGLEVGTILKFANENESANHCNGGKAVTLVVTHVDQNQSEIDSQSSNGTETKRFIIKKVSISFTCQLQNLKRVVNNNNQALHFKGVSYLVKNRNDQKAKLQVIRCFPVQKKHEKYQMNQDHPLKTFDLIPVCH